MEIIKSNKKILIDDEFSWIVKEYVIYIHNSYVICIKRPCTKLPQEKIRLHRLILDLKKEDKDILVDHINGNRLDNRKANLRKCNRHQNNLHKTSTANGKYRNIYPANKRLWRVSVQFKGKSFGCGRCFKNKDEAIFAAKKLREKIFGEFA